jgi:hypothetical protein
MVFSKKYPSFSKWLKKADKNSSYTQRITKLHKLEPDLTLNELSKARISDFDLSRKKWSRLTHQEKTKRNLSLEVLRRIRHGDSLTVSCEEAGISQKEAVKYLRSCLYKKKGRWIPKKYDSIERAMQIYENGEIRAIVIRGSKDSAIIGEYYNAVKNYLISGDSSYLKPFKKKTIIDAYGKKHKLETDPDKIRDIEESKEEAEFFEVYSDE